MRSGPEVTIPITNTQDLRIMARRSMPKAVRSEREESRSDQVEFAHKFATSGNTFVSGRIHGANGGPRKRRCGRCWNEANEAPCKKKERKGTGVAERVNSCVVVSYLLVPPPPTTVFLSVPFLPFSLSPDRSSSGAQADLNIKGGLNLTYTTLNHVTSIDL